MIRLIHPMGILKEVEGTLGVCGVKDGSKLVALITSSVLWDEELKGTNM
jgi:hypothetical protein